jgi:hypothetical protein
MLNGRFKPAGEGFQGLLAGKQLGGIHGIVQQSRDIFAQLLEAALQRLQVRRETIISPRTHHDLFKKAETLERFESLSKQFGQHKNHGGSAESSSEEKIDQ